MRWLSFAAIVIATIPSSQAEEKLDSIGYPSVQAAFEALQQDSTAKFRKQGDWVIVNSKEDKNFVIWSFTPPSYPAYPAVVKRVLFEKDGAIQMQMSALCQADKDPCDRLIEEFKILNNKIQEGVQKKSQTTTQPKAHDVVPGKQ